MDRPFFSIIVVAYNSGNYLQNCIDCAALQKFSDFEVIIVDNNCPERSTEKIVIPDHRFKVVRSEQNLGFSGGANLGAVSAKGEWVVMLNPDTLARADWLNELHLAIERHRQNVVFGSTVVSMQDPMIVDSFGDAYSIFGIAWQGGHGVSTALLPDNDKVVFGASGAAACYRLDIFRDFGGFDESYFCYLEDVDLSFRLLNAGHKCIQVRNAIVEHAGSASSLGNANFPIVYSNRNNFRLLVKNAPLFLVPVLLAFHILAQAYIIVRNARSSGTMARIRGLMLGLATIPSACCARRRTDKSSHSRWFWKLVSWSPRSLSNRSLVFVDIADL